MSTTTQKQTTPAATATQPERVLRPGTIVDYVLNSGRNVGAHRPAIVVRVWEPANVYTQAVQLQVFVDGTNDFDHGHPGSLTGLLWATSVHHDEEHKKPGTWHWPESESVPKENA